MLRYWGPRKFLLFIVLALILTAPASTRAQEEGTETTADERCAAGYAYHAGKRECVACNQPCRTGKSGICGSGLWECGEGGASCKAAVGPGDRMEICNDEDDDCDGRIDEGFDRDSDRYTTCSGDCNDRNPRIHPDAVERCDGLDNNCNGLIDDGFDVGGYCTSGLGVCMREGRLVCTKNGLSAVCDVPAGKPGEETCDGLDNDCDGEIDEGLGELTCGGGECLRTIAACQGGRVFECIPGEPSDELCGDGLDNDCDGKVDEGFAEMGRTCYEGVGACRAAGKIVCSDDRLSLACSAEPTEPKAEICGNRIDDDCDGEIDADVPGLGAPCTNDQMGVCKREGLLVCNAGEGLLECSVGRVEPINEICDGLDNDCDGEVDEGVQNACGGCGELPGEIGVVCGVAGGDECAKGVWTCDGELPAQAACLLKASLTEGGECASDGNPCTIDLCKEGVCTHKPAANGLACDDENPCTFSDGCLDGECAGGSQISCDDGNDCTQDSCDPTTGCVHAAIGEGAVNECGGCDALPGESDGDCTLSEKHGPCSKGRYVCQPDGAMLCVQSEFGGAEECNGIDDDCDGEIDEGLGTVTCGLGACTVEIAACRDNALAECVPGDPVPESCSNMGVDDDCNGVPDDVASLGNGCPVTIGSCIVPGKMNCVGDAELPVCVPENPADAEDADDDGVVNYCEREGAAERDAAESGTTAAVGALFDSVRTRAAILPWREVFDAAVVGAKSPGSAMILVSGATGDKAGFAVLRAKDVAENEHFSFTSCSTSVGERPRLIAAAESVGSVIASSDRSYLRYHKITSQIPSPSSAKPECRLYGERIPVAEVRSFEWKGGAAECEVKSIEAIALMGQRPLIFAGAVICEAEPGSALRSGRRVLGVDIVSAGDAGDYSHHFVPFSVNAKGIEEVRLVSLGQGKGAPLFMTARIDGKIVIGTCVEEGDSGWRCRHRKAAEIGSEVVFVKNAGGEGGVHEVVLLTKKGDSFAVELRAADGSLTESHVGRAATTTGGGAVEEAILLPGNGRGERYLIMGRERTLSAASLIRADDGRMRVRQMGDVRMEPRSEVDGISPGGKFSFARPHAMAAMPLKRFGGTDLFAAYGMRKAGRSVGAMGFIYWNSNEVPGGRITDITFDGARGQARLAFTDPTGDRLSYRSWIRAKHGGSLDHWVDGLEGGWLRFSVKGDQAAVGLWPVELIVEAADPAGATVRSRAILGRDGTVESITEVSE